MLHTANIYCVFSSPALSWSAVRKGVKTKCDEGASVMNASQYITILEEAGSAEATKEKASTEYENFSPKKRPNFYNTMVLWQQRHVKILVSHPNAKVLKCFDRLAGYTDLVAV